MKIGRLEFKIKHIGNNTYRLSIDWMTRKEIEKAESHKKVEYYKKMLEQYKSITSQRKNDKL